MTDATIPTTTTQDAILDEILDEILSWAHDGLPYGAVLKPVTIQHQGVAIQFYRVGGNSSHMAFLGLGDDGKHYCRCWDGGQDDDIYHKPDGRYYIGRGAVVDVLRRVP